MKEQESKADKNSTASNPKQKQSSTHEVDPLPAPVKHDEPLGRVGIAPAKPVWPSKK